MNNGYFYGNYPQPPYGYQTQMQRQGQMANMPMQQPQMQPQMQPQQPMPSSFPFGEVKFVTREEALSHTLFPNTSALLIDRQNRIAYVKQADGLGQSFIQAFSYLTVENPSQEPKNAPQGTTAIGGIDMSPYITNEQLEAKNYATRGDLENVVAKIDELSKKMAQKPNTTTPKTQGDKQ